MTTTTVVLEHGKKAVLRDPKLLTNGQRRPIVLACDRYMKQHLSAEFVREVQRAVAAKDEKRQLELAQAIQLGVDETATLKTNEVVITVMVESWTLDLPLPSEKPIHDETGELIGSEVLEDLLALDYDRLQWAAGTLLPALRWQGDPPGKAPARAPRSSARSKRQ